MIESFSSADALIARVLSRDAKSASYKIALIRAINDVVLAYPDIGRGGLGVAVPLRRLAEQWIAYYWPFCDREVPIWQGRRPSRGGKRRNDVAFRPELEQLRAEWARLYPGGVMPADGFLLVDHMRVRRVREQYPDGLRKAYRSAIRKVARSVRQPIRYAGAGGEHYTIFPKPVAARELAGLVRPTPGTRGNDASLVVPLDLWSSFRRLSMWVEALALHEWSLWCENLASDTPAAQSRGHVYDLLTDRPGNRRPLSWERNRIDLLLLQGTNLTCPWTRKPIRSDAYDIDHIVPVAAYPTDELWNLVPSDSGFNRHIKRDRLPSRHVLEQARGHLEDTYRVYDGAPDLGDSLRYDVRQRFSDIAETPGAYAPSIVNAVVDLVETLAASRNLERF